VCFATIDDGSVEMSGHERHHGLKDRMEIHMNTVVDHESGTPDSRRSKMPFRHFAALLSLLMLLAVQATAGQDSKPILVDYGSKPRWSPNEQSIAFMRNDSLFVKRLDSSQTAKFIHSGPVVSLEWIDDSTIVAQELHDTRNKDATFSVTRIWLLTLSGQTTEIASDSCSMSDSRCRSLQLRRLTDRTVGFHDASVREHRVTRISSGGALETGTLEDSQSLFVATKPAVWGKVWLYHGLGDSGRQVTLSENHYSFTRLAPSLDKFTCNASNGNLVVFDTLGNELGNLGEGWAPVWDSQSEYAIFLVEFDSEFDVDSEEVWVAKFDGTEKRRVPSRKYGTGYNVSFAHHSPFVIFANRPDGGIYIMKIR
jgi:hypothetical protein